MVEDISTVFNFFEDLLSTVFIFKAVNTSLLIHFILCTTHQMVDILALMYTAALLIPAHTLVWIALLSYFFIYFKT